METSNNNFVKDSLKSGEKILATAKFHPAKNILLCFGFFIIITVIYSLIFGSIRGNDVFEDGWWWGAIICFLVSFVGLYPLAQWISRYDEFVITNLRVVAKTGVFRRVSFELYIDQIESIEAYQGVLDRIMNCGTVMPCGIGASKVRIPFVVNPFEFRQHFYDLKNTARPFTESNPAPTKETPGADKYFAQPQSDGKFHVVERNSVTGEFVPIKDEVYDTEFEARKRAKALNVEFGNL